MDESVVYFPGMESLPQSRTQKKTGFYTGLHTQSHVLSLFKNYCEVLVWLPTPWVVRFHKILSTIQTSVAFDCGISILGVDFEY